jgi:beta-glucosidase
VEAILAANPNTVVVVNAGSPMTMPWIDKAKAVLVTWLPGEEGPHALANVLFGFSAPSGRLPVTFPKRIEDIPTFKTYRGGATAPYSEGLFVGYRHYDKEKIAPLFPFGHGLSYTTFAYSDLKAPSRAKAGEPVDVQITVTNTGKRAGRETVQLYVAPKNPSLPRAPKELKGFVKVSLKPGESKTVSLPLDARAFSFYDPKAKRWVAEPGDYELVIAASATDTRLSHSLRLE